MSDGKGDLTVKVSENGKWYRVSLRLTGDTLPIDELDSRLEVTADKKNRKGAKLRPTGETCRTNVWVMGTPHDSNIRFEEQISWLLDKIEPKKEILRELANTPGIETELFLGYGSENGQGGAVISADTLRRISECGLDLDIDLYPPPGPDED